MKLNVLFWAFVSVLLAGCKSDYDAPCRDKVVKVTNEFTNEQVEAIPYEKNDSVVFVSATLDTVSLLTKLYQSAYSYSPSVMEGNPECPADLDAFQVLQVNLSDSATGLGLQSLWRRVNDSCYYTISGRLFSLKITNIGKAVGQYADSVVINQKVFYQVNTIYEAGGDSIIVNKNFGVVYFVAGGKSYRMDSYNIR